MLLLRAEAAGEPLRLLAVAAALLRAELLLLPLAQALEQALELEVAQRLWVALPPVAVLLLLELTEALPERPPERVPPRLLAEPEGPALPLREPVLEARAELLPLPLPASTAPPALLLPEALTE